MAAQDETLWDVCSSILQDLRQHTKAFHLAWALHQLADRTYPGIKQTELRALLRLKNGVNLRQAAGVPLVFHTDMYGVYCCTLSGDFEKVLQFAEAHSDAGPEYFAKLRTLWARISLETL